MWFAAITTNKGLSLQLLKKLGKKSEIQKFYPALTIGVFAGLIVTILEFSWMK